MAESNKDKFDRVSLKSKLFLILFSLLVLGLSSIFVYLRGQDNNWDLLNYHFYTGYALLHDRFIHDISAANLQSYLNPTINVITYLSLRHIPFPFSGWSLLIFQLSSIPALVLIAREIGKGMGYTNAPFSEILALILCLIAPLWWSELGTSFFSSTTAPLVLWGLYLLIRESSNHPLTRHDLIIGGILFGLGSGLKLTNAPFAVAAFIALLYLSYGKGLRSLLGKLAAMCFGIIIGFATTVWWNWYLWNSWGSPLFPLYNAIFKSPYYDMINWRDMRWHFASMQEFITFLMQSIFGTSKTSEIRFADLRLPLVFLLLPGAILCKPAISIGKQAIALLLFVFSGFTLWAVMLAYQRYLIPIELLLGLVFWILVLRLIEREWIRIIVLVSMIATSVHLVQIPDWGHTKVAFGERDPFSIDIPKRVSDTPARYIVVGNPISYILPYLNADSIFYGINFSKQVNDIIKDALSQPSNLPLRILSSNHDAYKVWDQLATLNYSPASHGLDCTPFKTRFDQYVICEIDSTSRKIDDETLIVDAKFYDDTYLQRKGILWDSGLSVAEHWGRWSDGDIVEFGFTRCLPRGNLRLAIIGHAFGPNIGKPVPIFLGSNEERLIFNQSDAEAMVHFSNHDECTNKLTVHIPESKSPEELQLGPDPRKLGIGFVELRISVE